MMMSDACKFFGSNKIASSLLGLWHQKVCVEHVHGQSTHPKITEGLPGTSLFFAAIDVVNRSASALSVFVFRFLKQTASSTQSSDVSI